MNTIQIKGVTTGTNTTTLVTVTATANSGYHFDYWSITSGSLSQTGEITGNITGTATFAGNTYTATFYYNNYEETIHNTDNKSEVSNPNYLGINKVCNYKDKNCNNDKMNKLATGINTITTQCTVTSGNNCTITIPSEVTSSNGLHGNAYAGLRTSYGSDMNPQVAKSSTSVTLTANTSYYSLYSTEIKIYYPTSTNAISSKSTYQNQWFINNSTLSTTVLSSTATGTTTDATAGNLVSGYSLVGFATDTGINEENCGTTIAELAQDESATEETRNVYQIEKKENNISVYFLYSKSTDGSIDYKSTSGIRTHYLRPISKTASGTDVANSDVTVPSISNEIAPTGTDSIGWASGTANMNITSTYTTYGANNFVVYSKVYRKAVAIYKPVATSGSNSCNSTNAQFYRNAYVPGDISIATLNTTKYNKVLSTTSTGKSDNATYSSEVSGYTIAGYATSSGGGTPTITYATLIGSDTPVRDGSENIVYAILSRTIEATFYYSTAADGTVGSTTANGTQYARCSTSTMSVIVNSSISPTITGEVAPTGTASDVWSTSVANIPTTSLTPSTSHAGSNTTVSFYRVYTKMVTITKPNTTSVCSNTVFYRNAFYESGTKYTKVLSETRTGITNTATYTPLSGYSLSGFATAYGTNTITYNNLDAVKTSTTTQVYAVLNKSVTGTFYYNSNTTVGETTISTATTSATQYLRCTSATVAGSSNSNFTVPTVVQNSVGTYNNAYAGVQVIGTNNMTTTTPTTANTSFYAVYRTNVTNYYWDSSSYASRTLYRNQYIGFVEGFNIEAVETYYSEDPMCQVQCPYDMGMEITLTDRDGYPLEGIPVLTPDGALSYTDNHGYVELDFSGVTGSPNDEIIFGDSTFGYMWGHENTPYWPSGSSNVDIFLQETIIYSTDTVLSTSATGTSNYATETGPGSSVWDYLSAICNEPECGSSYYPSVADAARTPATALNTAYKMNVAYQKGSNVSSIGETTGECYVYSQGQNGGTTSCDVTLPTITPSTGYHSVGWSTTNGDTTGTAAEQDYTISTNNTTLYANAAPNTYKLIAVGGNSAYLTQSYWGYYTSEATNTSCVSTSPTYCCAVSLNIITGKYVTTGSTALHTGVSCSSQSHTCETGVEYSNKKTYSNTHNCTLSYTPPGSTSNEGYYVTTYGSTVSPCSSTLGSCFRERDYGSTYGTLPTVTKSGYTFDGWWTAAEGGTQVTSSTVFNTDDDIRIYAHWKQNWVGIPTGNYSSGDTISYAGQTWTVVSDNGEYVDLALNDTYGTGAIADDSTSLTNNFIDSNSILTYDIGNNGLKTVSSGNYIDSRANYTGNLSTTDSYWTTNGQFRLGQTIRTYSFTNSTYLYGYSAGSSGTAIGSVNPGSQSLPTTVNTTATYSAGSIQSNTAETKTYNYTNYSTCTTNNSITGIGTSLLNGCSQTNSTYYSTEGKRKGRVTEAAASNSNSSSYKSGKITETYHNYDASGAEASNGTANSRTTYFYICGGEYYTGWYGIRASGDANKFQRRSPSTEEWGSNLSTSNVYWQAFAGRATSTTKTVSSNLYRTYNMSHRALSASDYHIATEANTGCKQLTYYAWPPLTRDTTISIHYRPHIVVRKGDPSNSIYISSFSTMSDSQFVSVLEQAYNGTVDLEEDYGWKVGDERQIQLSSFTYKGYDDAIATSNGSTAAGYGRTITNPAQTVTLVILHKGGKTLAGGGTAKYVVGFKEVIAPYAQYDNYTAGSSATVNGNYYPSSALRTTMNNIYNALPSTIKPAFKQWNVKVADRRSNPAVITSVNDYFAEPASWEIFGSGYFSSKYGYEGVLCSPEAENDAIAAESGQFDYYANHGVTPENYAKAKKYYNGYSEPWMLRSPCNGGTIHFGMVEDDGSRKNSDGLSTMAVGVSPIGCI